MINVCHQSFIMMLRVHVDLHDFNANLCSNPINHHKFIPHSRLQRINLHLRRLQRTVRSSFQRLALLRSGEKRLASRRNAWNVPKGQKKTILHRDRKENVFVWRNMVSDLDLDA